MTNIIKELLLLVSIRKEEVKQTPLDMAAIIAETQQRLSYIIDEANAELIIPAAFPTALGYAPWIEEVWANYISNAIKYGGQPPKLEIKATLLPDGLARFSLKDNGSGIPATEQEKLFVPFERLGKLQIKGQGLGLSIVRRILEKLGGQAGAENHPGEGSEFYFILPALPASRSSPE